MPTTQQKQIGKTHSQRNHRKKEQRMAPKHGTIVKVIPH